MLDRNKLRYRQGVVAFVRNKKGEYLIFQHPEWAEDHWRVPGGGIREGEDYEAAIIRELSEEFGITQIDIKNKSNIINQYEWPDELIQDHVNKGRTPYRGQQQIQVLIEVEDNIDIKTDPNEVKNFMWVTPDSFRKYFTFGKDQGELALKTIEDFKKNGY